MGRNISISPTYKATSLEERLKPLLLYKEEYEKQQDAFDKLLEDTAILENIKNSEVDADLYRDYSTWRETLNSAASDLSTTGILNLQELRDIRRQYLHKFKPMEDVYKHRSKLIAEQAANASPDVLYSKTFSDTALSDMTLDDTYTSIKLSDIQKKAYDDAVGRYMESGLPEDYAEDIDKLFEELNTQGFSDADQGAIRNNLLLGYNKAAAAISEYDQKKRLTEAQIAKTLADSNIKPGSGGSKGTTKDGKVTYEDPITGKKHTLYMKDNVLYTDNTYKTKYVNGTITNEEKIKYNGMVGVSYEDNSTFGVRSVSRPADATKVSSLNSYDDYTRFMTGVGTAEQREALSKIIEDKKINPRILYAAGVVMNIYTTPSGNIIVEVNKKPAAAPPGQ